MTHISNDMLITVYQLEELEMKILIIEDERLLADSLKLMLESKGFQAERKL